MRLRVSIPMFVLAAAGCIPWHRQPVAPIVITEHDRIMARALLEDASVDIGGALAYPDSLFEPMARAVASLRRVDSMVGAELGHSAFDAERSQVVLTTRDATNAAGKRSARILDCVGPAITPLVRSEGFSVTLPPQCWPELFAALPALARARVVVTPLADDGLMATVTVAPEINRSAIAVLLKRQLQPRSASINWLFPGDAWKLDRSHAAWRFSFTRDYGGCDEICHFHPRLEYRYDPRTDRAWKHGESGDPWPPPKASTLP